MNTAAPAPTDQPQSHFAELRQWIAQNLHTGHPVRQASYQMALSAAVHRLIKFGPDETLNSYTARDLMALLIYTNGTVAEWLMRTAFTRALIENDALVYEKLASTLFIHEPRLWYWKVVEGLIGEAKDPKETTEWVEALPAEEKGIARLMACRVFPDLCHPTWLDETPNPHIQAQFCRTLLQNKKYRSLAQAFLRSNPMARNYLFTLG